MKTTFQKAMPWLRDAGLFFALVLSLALAPSAHAHARLVKSVPAKNAILSKSPEQIDLWFNELLEEGFNTIEVFNSSELNAGKHTNLAKGKPVVDAKDHTHLSASLEPLAPGEYVLEWRVLSRDGHSAPGRIIFRVGK